MDVSGGAERLRKWPRKRGKNLPQVTKDQNDWFLQAQWATKYIPAIQMVQAMEATENTPLLPRDIMTMLFANRMFMLSLPDGRRLYPTVARNDVSESLDVIGSVQGTILFRGLDWWSPLTPGTVGQVLTSNGPGADPEWKTPGGGGGMGLLCWARQTTDNDWAGATWGQRPMTTLEYNDFGASLVSGGVQLPAGTYTVEAIAQSIRDNGARLRVRDVTNNVTVAYGLSGWSGAATGSGVGATTQITAFGRFVLGAPAVIELQHYRNQTTTSFADSGVRLGAVGGETSLDSNAEMKIWQAT